MTTKVMMGGLAMLLLAGCAGRAPAPVEVAQAGDAGRACAAIAEEIGANQQRIGELGRERGGKVVQNVAAGVAGLIVWPALFLMDFQGAATAEQEALEQRQVHLAAIAREKGC